MSYRHLFEFLDQEWVPASIRTTELEILECCHTQFRHFFHWVSNQVLEHAKQRGFKQIVELGAGSAPVARLLAQDNRTDDIQLVACDLIPNVEVYGALEQQYPGKVKTITSPVDFSQPYQWEPQTLLLITSSFHHISPEDRPKTLAALTHSADGVMICESLHNNLVSILSSFGGIVPSLLLPILLFNKPGKMRRVFWCWLFPVVPLMFLWDSVVSCLRQWDESQWHSALRELSDASRVPTVKSTFNTQLVIW